MKDLLSPKQVAASIGVSESSLKRWCDQGALTSERTPGGHRRIRIAEVVRFLRDRDQTVIRPELLGLPPGLGRTAGSYEKACAELTDVLKEGDGDGCRRIVLDVYLSGSTIVKLCEDLIAPAMRTIGECWEGGDLEVFQEHRASEIVNRSLYDLRTLLPPPAPDSPTAMGGSPEGDHYRLSSLVVELALAEAGWDAISLGCSLPFETISAALRRHKPRLFWLSFSHAVDSQHEATRAGFESLLESLPEETHIALGGQKADQALGEDHSRVHHCDSLSSLAELAASL